MVSRLAVVRKVEVFVSNVCRDIVVSFEVAVTSTVGIIVVSRVAVGWVGLVAVAVIVVVFKFAVASVDVIIVVLMVVVEVVLDVPCIIEDVCKSSHVAELQKEPFLCKNFCDTLYVLGIVDLRLQDFTFYCKKNTLSCRKLSFSKI